MNSSGIETFAPRFVADTTGWASVLAKMVWRPLAWFRQQRRIRRDTALLMEFNDSALADVGLSRGEVLYAVHHGRLPEGSPQRLYPPKVTPPIGVRVRSERQT